MLRSLLRSLDNLFGNAINLISGFWFLKYVNIILLILTFILASNLRAEATSCTRAAPDYPDIGVEYIASTCPGQELYNYASINLTCNSNNEVEGYYYNPNFASDISPDTFIQKVKTDAAWYSQKVFINSAKTHVLAVSKYASINGSPINGYGAVNGDVFGVINPTYTLPCCMSLLPVTIPDPLKPSVGEELTINPSVTSNYPTTLKLEIGGVTSTSTTSSIKWSGKDTGGFPLLPGNYTGTLTASTESCGEANSTFSATVSQPPNDSTGFCGFGSSANLAGGNLSHRDDILSVNGGLLPLSLSIDYNSQDTSISSIGANWRHSLDITLSDAGNDAVLLREGGAKKLYLYNSGDYQTPAGDNGKLTGTIGGTHDLTYKNGLVYHFLATGQVETIIDRYGNKLTFVYSGGGLYTVTDSNGQQLTFNGGGSLQSVNDPKGNTYTFTRHPAQNPATPQDGKLWKVTNPQTDIGITAGYREYIYDDYGNLKSRKDPNNNLTQYTINNATKRVTSSIDPDGSSNAANHTRTITYPITVSEVMTTTFKEKDGGDWTYTYNSKKGVLQSITDGNGKTTRYDYDEFDGSLKALTVPYDGILKYTTFYTHDGSGNLLTETDPIDISGYTALQGYDLTLATPAFLAGLTPPIVPALRYTWDVKDRLASISNERDSTFLTTTITYQTEVATGLELTTISDPESKTTKLRRDPANGKVMEIEDGNGKKTVFTYYPVNPANTAIGSAGLLESIKTPDLVKTTFSSYDKDGNPGVIQTTDANNVLVPVSTAIGYDALNRLRSITQNLTAQSKTLTKTYDFDSNGNLTEKDPQQVAKGTSPGTRYDYNYNNKVKRITDAVSGVTDFTYGGQSCPSCGGIDQLTAVKDPRQSAKGVSGKSTLFLYDQAGRLKKETDPVGKVTSYTYYDNGLLRGVYDGDPGTLLVSYNYNNRGQLLDKTRSDNSKDIFTYKPNGFMDTATTKNPDNSTLISYTFDWYKNGWLKSAIDTTNSKTITYDQYDGIGQRKQVTFFTGTADQRIVTYDYDTANRPSFITDNFGTPVVSTDDIVFSFTYDERGRRQTLGFPNLITATYGYDDLNQLTSLTHLTNNSTNIATITYPEYYDAGNRKTKTVVDPDNGSKSETYLYDDLYRLQKTTTFRGDEVFTYDEVGNRRSGPGPKDTGINVYQYDDANRMTIGRLLSYSYDNRGNQTVKTVPNASDNRAWVQNFDGENRLTSVVKTKGTEVRTVKFDYDSFGRRIGKAFTIKRGNTTLTSNSWKYSFDNDKIALESYTDNTGTPANTFFIYDTDLNTPLVMVRGSQYFTYHADGLGSTIAIADKDKNVVERYSYDSYGMVKPTKNFRNSFTYTGGEWDKEAGLYHFDWRYYDPIEGRFINKDPISFLGGINLYGYTSGNPINYIDPSGTEMFLVGRIPPWLRTLAKNVSEIQLERWLDSPQVKRLPSEINKAKDETPSWLDKAQNNRPLNKESGKDFAKRVCNDRYGNGNWKKGAGEEYSKIQKYGDTHFKKAPLPESSNNVFIPGYNPDDIL